ncbi:Golgi-specific brefeldin A-resistance guanine nucleotide exchange factor 1 [Echinococcus granulosus]|nr:Golgi-specific brefeldin A-resistance guanine nucleotide exchange factor 1 [Echinococcus granulosus]
MAPPNALSMVKSEVSMLLTSMKCGYRSNFRFSQDDAKRALLDSLTSLRRTLNDAPDLDSLNPLTYLTPFLDVIRSDATTGPITGLALTSVEKFLAYGLLEVRPDSSNASQSTIGIAMETIADAVIQARFIRSRLSSDEVVLMKIVHLLRTLLLIPSGCLLSNMMVREILQNCLRICLESQLSELLRRTAEHFLASIVQLFFSRLPALLLAAETSHQDEEEGDFCISNERLSRKGSRRSTIHAETSLDGGNSEANQEEVKTEDPSADKYPLRDESICSLGDHLVADRQTPTPTAATSAEVQPLPSPSSHSPVSFSVEIGQEAEEHLAEVEATSIFPGSRMIRNDAAANGLVFRSHNISLTLEPQEITFMNYIDTSNEHICRPYNLQAVHNLFALLVNLLNPEEHQEGVIKVSLNLLTVAMETGADFLHACPAILRLVATDMTKYLMMLLYRERIPLFAATLRLAFLLFEALRMHLKLQLEVYFQRLIALISSDNERITYEHREIALDAVVQLFLLPGLAAEIYMNYDCDPYCSNLFEDITEMLTKNAYPVNRLVSINIIALDALLAVIDAIDIQTGESDAEEVAEKTITRLTDFKRSIVRPNRHWIPSSVIPTHENLVAQKTRKKLLMSGSDRFNLKQKDGIVFLQKNGLLSDPLDPVQIAAFLAENPRLDKKMIGEYLANRKNTDILVAFVRHFNFRGTQIDEALRAYLEAFRIPGEAPLIQHLMESFAEQWYEANDAPFANVDAAFTLAYALLMLNTDQHNPNSRRQNVPMTCADFKRNLKGMNGGGEFDSELVESVYKSIREREIVMPSEQTGAVRDNYLWKCLVRRSSQSSFQHYVHLPPGQFDADLFTMLWGSTVAALSFVLDKSTDVALQAKTMAGFVRCARIAAHFRMTQVFDNLIISLCKFTLLLSPNETSESVGVALGRSSKAQMATRLVFALAATHGDMLREGWRSILLDCLLRLLHAHLLPPGLVRPPHFLSAGTSSGFSAAMDSSEHLNDTGGRSDRGVLGSLYHYLTLGSSTNLEPLSSPPLDTRDAPQNPFEEPSTPSQPRCFSNATGLFRLMDESAISDAAALPFTLPQSVHDDDFAAIQAAKTTVEACQIDALFEESKFLMLESLQELIKALLYGLTNDGRGTDACESVVPDTVGGERSQIFCLELLLQVLLYNRDRIDQLWLMVRGDLVAILRSAREPTALVECVVAGMLRLALQLLRRQQDLATQIFACLLTILKERGAYLLRPPSSPSRSTTLTSSTATATSVTPGSRRLLHRHRSSEFTKAAIDDGGSSSVARQVVWGVDALLSEEGGAMAVEVPSPQDWQLILGLLEVCGAGAFPITPAELEGQAWDHRQGQHQEEPRGMRREDMYSSLQNVTADAGAEVSRDFASDSESCDVKVEALRQHPPTSLNGGVGAGVESWVLVNVVDRPETTEAEKGRGVANEDAKKEKAVSGGDLVPSSRLRLPIVIVFQDWFALEKACGSIAFVVRDPAHITPNNIEYCVHTLRVFIEAVLTPPKPSIIRKTLANGTNERVSPPPFDFSEGRPPEPFTSGIALQLLDLAYTLFSRAPSIYAEWTKPTEVEDGREVESTGDMIDASIDCLWPSCWRALLQAIARLCVDARRDVRADALAFLQRALLSPILHLLTGPQWLDCFLQVLFPLLTNFLESVTFNDSTLTNTSLGGTSAAFTTATGVGVANRVGRDSGSQGNLSTVGFFSNIFGGGSGNSGGVESAPTVPMVPGALAEYTDPRMRAIPLLTKVFLQHLNPLYALEAFPQLWERMLTYMERYIKANISDSLNDAVRESLKNLLLVLYTGTQDTAPILVRDAPEGSREALLWFQTYTHLERFMPNLMDQLFPPPPPPPPPPEAVAGTTAAAVAGVPTPGVAESAPPSNPTCNLDALSTEVKSSEQAIPPTEAPHYPTGEVRIQLPMEESD